MLFVVTAPLYRQFDAMWELEWALGEDVSVKKTKYPGVILARTPRSREDAVRALKEYETTAIFKAIPLDFLISCTREDLMETVLTAARAGITAEDSFAVRVKRRGTRLAESSRDLERDIGAKIVDEVGATVNLDYPSKTVRVEIFGTKVGVAVLGPDDIVTKEVAE